MLAGLHRDHGVVRVDEPATPGWLAGLWCCLVLRHAKVEAVLERASTFPSWLARHADP
ncbi:MAG: hypothetical protein ACYCYA_11155 [Actinomycetes bacterium]